MCGIAGFLCKDRADMSAGQCRDTALKVAHAVAYRGPDDCGVWVDENSGVGMAHRRLSVIDLSPAGHQPMVSQGGRFVMVFNGEIYNHLEVRHLLEMGRAAPVWKILNFPAVSPSGV